MKHTRLGNNRKPNDRSVDKSEQVKKIKEEQKERIKTDRSKHIRN